MNQRRSPGLKSGNFHFCMECQKFSNFKEMPHLVINYLNSIFGGHLLILTRAIQQCCVRLRGALLCLSLL